MKSRKACCLVGVGGLGGDKDRVDAESDALGGIDRLELGIRVEGGDHLGGEHVADRRLARDHEVVGGVVVKRPDVRAQGHQLLLGLLQHGGVGLVEALAHRFEVMPMMLARVVHHDEPSLRTPDSTGLRNP